MVQFALNNEKLREWGKTKETPAFYYFCLGGNKTFFVFPAYGLGGKTVFLLPMENILRNLGFFQKIRLIFR